MLGLQWIEFLAIITLLFEIRTLEPATTIILKEGVVEGSSIELIGIKDNKNKYVKETQNQAKSTCNDEEGNLPTLDSIELFNFFCETLREHSITNELWVHASDETTEGVFLWDNGDEVEGTYFGGTVPSNKNKDCATVIDDGSNCQLQDKKCSQDAIFVCLQGKCRWIGNTIDSLNMTFFRSPSSDFQESADAYAYVRWTSINMASSCSGLYSGRFPQGFIWASATAAYQIEGGWNADGKGESIWDRFSHTPGLVENGDTGDIACDSYHLYNEDIQIIKDVGCSHYRFSISWPRILPDGTTRYINPAGIAYYNRLIDGLLAAGIQPVVTLYHFDLPQALQDEGGWADERIVQWFADFADLCFKHFGDRVKWWVTLNEPKSFASIGYGSGEFAPGIRDPYISVFKVIRNAIRAHTKAYRLYEEKYKAAQRGKVGLTKGTDGFFPQNDGDPSDIEAVELAYQVHLGMFANPFLGDGDYPVLVREKAKEIAQVKGLPKPLLLAFTAEEKTENKGACDFLGINNYTSRLVSMANIKDKSAQTERTMGELFGINNQVDPSWKRSKIGWLYQVPEGLRALMNWIKKSYDNPPVLITENGTTDDMDRSQYIRSYINELLKASVIDGCQIIGYTVWSLTDNFEWACGYSQRFGLYKVDYEDPKRKRTPKDSVKVYREIIENNGFPES